MFLMLPTSKIEEVSQNCFIFHAVTFGFQFVPNLNQASGIGFVGNYLPWKTYGATHSCVYGP